MLLLALVLSLATAVSARPLLGLHFAGGGSLFGSHVDVRAMGGDPADGNDDTAAIAAAVAVGRAVFFPKGVWNSTADIQMLTNQLFFGEGKDSVIELQGAGVEVLLGNFCTIRDLTIRGTGSGEICIRTKDGSSSYGAWWLLSNVECRQARVGLNVSNAWTGMVLGCRFRYCGTGVRFDDATANPSANNNITFLGGLVYGNTKGVQFVHKASCAHSRINLYGVNIEDNSEAGVCIDDGVTSLKLDGCWFEDNRNDIEVNADTELLTVTDCQFNTDDNGDVVAPYWAVRIHDVACLVVLQRNLFHRGAVNTNTSPIDLGAGLVTADVANNVYDALYTDHVYGD
jgi:hypothetical protein